ncbi:MAG: ribonuclease E activity regulator RraA [Archangium sp.]
MPSPKTADLVDSHDAQVRFCQLAFERHGTRLPFHGVISTVKTFEDNTLLKKRLEEPGNGRVLVVDGGGSARVAVVGDVIAALAQKNGWAGLIINGAVRDVAVLAEMDFAVFAIARSPKKSSKLGTGALDVPVSFGGVEFVPGQFVYADDDGVLVSAANLAT